MCLTISTLHILQYHFGVPPDDTLPIKQLVDKLEQYVKAGTNEAQRRRDMFNCKQELGEFFNDFYVRVKSFAESVNICKVIDTQWEEIQFNQVLLMGVDQELVKEVVRTIATQILDETV